MRSLLLILPRFPTIALALTVSLAAQDPPAQAPPNPPPASTLSMLSYPDSTSGLERLAKDIVKAQSQNDGPRADALLQSFVLPNAYDWYARVFDREAAHNAGKYYQDSAATIPSSLSRIFLKASQEKLTHIQAVRYEHGCDDVAAPDAFGILLRRSERAPLYELRFLNGNQIRRIFPLAYVEGAFRFFLAPDFHPPAQTQDVKTVDSEKKSSSQENSPALPRVVVQGTAQLPKLINRVKPVYPEKARQEGISGVVKVHVIIDRDGRVSRILGVLGVCSLAESGVNAVRQWRYSPTLIHGNPAEVDTDLDVIFFLGR